MGLTYSSLTNKIINMAHSCAFEESTTERGLHRFEQLTAPYYGICNVEENTWCIYKGGYKTPLTTVILIDTEENGVFEKFIKIFSLYEVEYNTYNYKNKEFGFKKAHTDQINMWQ